MQREVVIINKQTLFINASQNRHGNTSRLAARLIHGNYDQLNLVDYKIYQLGQHYSDDEFHKVVKVIDATSDIVIGTPVYWHSLSGYVKVLLERLSQMDHPEILRGKTLSVFVQGADPSDTEGPTKAIVKRFAEVMGMEYQEI